MKKFVDRTPRASARHRLPVRDVFQLLGIRAFPASIRALLEELSCWDCLRLVRRLDPDTAAALYQHLDAKTQQVVIEHLPASVLAGMAAYLPPPERERLCRALPPGRRAAVRKAVASRPRAHAPA